MHRPDDLQKLAPFVEDSITQSKFYNVKQQRKQILADYIKEHNGIDVDVNSIFDIKCNAYYLFISENERR